MIKGSCCCGAVQFELTEKPSMMGMCHCSRCRKVGSSSLLFVKSAEFQITAGQDRITVYRAKPPYKYDRYFCSVCGTSLGDVLSEMETFPINANCIDDDIEIENQFHVFVSEKPSWFKIGDNAEQYDKYPQGQ